MTRKDYQLLASALKTTRPARNDAGFPVWQHTVHTVADALKRDNAGFKHDRFYAACGEGE